MAGPCLTLENLNGFKDVENSPRKPITLSVMKTKITFLIASIALVTLSFTFASVKEPKLDETPARVIDNSAPVGGLYADDVVD